MPSHTPSHTHAHARCAPAGCDWIGFGVAQAKTPLAPFARHALHSLRCARAMPCDEGSARIGRAERGGDAVARADGRPVRVRAMTMVTVMDVMRCDAMDAAMHRVMRFGSLRSCMMCCACRCSRVRPPRGTGGATPSTHIALHWHALQSPLHMAASVERARERVCAQRVCACACVCLCTVCAFVCVVPAAAARCVDVR